VQTKLLGFRPNQFKTEHYITGRVAKQSGNFGPEILDLQREWTPIMVSLIDFVLGWLNEWEIRELDWMFANPPSAKPQPPKGDRRVNLEKRRSVSAMSPEELLRELLTSEVTGLPNRRAFGEAGAALAVAMSDVDGLKALNDSYGYDAGNALLKAKADALREAGLEAYHDKGDEFLCRGNDIKELLAKLERARGILRDRAIVVERADGSTVSVAGGDFSYGVGKDINEAEFGLKSHKADREGRGEIARGDVRGIAIKVERQKHSRPELSAL
jgi:GGDEF domain-containing protein